MYIICALYALLITLHLLGSYRICFKIDILKLRVYIQKNVIYLSIGSIKCLLPFEIVVPCEYNGVCFFYYLSVYVLSGNMSRFLFIFVVRFEFFIFFCFQFYLNVVGMISS